MTDLACLSATQLVAMIRRREISSRELLEHYLQRVERLNPRLNAVVTLDPEGARLLADAADAALARGDSLGPLHGLPITIKDTIETAGIRTTAGFERLAEHIPSRNAVAVQRLVEAGALVFGKTNAATLGGDWQTHNALFGVTRNPWNPERSSGGSSGGSAAAMAAGLSALELGSDIAGSIRLPASWCGVYGHKTSHGVIPWRGHIPGPPGALSEPDLSVLGPLARSAEDLEIALSALVGPRPDRAIAWRLELPPPRRQSLRDYRVAAWLADALCPLDAEVEEVLHSALDALARAGVRVDPKGRPSFALAEAFRVYLQLFWPLFLAGLPKALFDRLCEAAPTLPAQADDATARMIRFATGRHRQWLAANEARERLRAQLAAFFQEFDVLLCPVSPVAAIRHDHREPIWERRLCVNGEERPYLEISSWLGLATATFLPATSAPLGRTRSDLPVGLQIIGPYLEDRTAIDFARRLAELVGGYEVPPL